ncbi:MAG: hypothetical protein KKE57_01860 [Proteobacteria bacterium]|nr:hypothetical protein [Pseudomonadota bacterium]
MKKTIIVMTIAFVLGFGYLAMDADAQMGPGMMGPGYGQGMGPGMMGPGGGPGYGPQQGGDWNYCPYCGSPVGPGSGMGPGMMGPGYGMGPGMMGRGMGPGMMGPGYGMGPGMMGPGYGQGMGPGMMGPGYGYGPQYQQPQKPMEEKDAQALLDDYLKSTRNPNLKLGKIKDTGSAFEAEIATKEGSLVDKIAIDKATGWMRSIY